MNFLTRDSIFYGSWQSFERAICRLFMCRGYTNVRIVGGSGDYGADVIASFNGKRFIIQAKQWNKPVNVAVIEETLGAMSYYEADVAIIISSRGFDKVAEERKVRLMKMGIGIQLWSTDKLLSLFEEIPKDLILNTYSPYDYQEEAIEAIVNSFFDEYYRKSLIVLATGLGKTFVAAESIHRIYKTKKLSVLVLAHVNPLVYQLERSFWPFLYPGQSTVVWNGYEHPSREMLEKSDFVFACIDTVSLAMEHGEFYDFDFVMVDECHHAGSNNYRVVLDHYMAEPSPPYLLGLSATPWRGDLFDIGDYFGKPVITVSMEYGINHGYLANVDYRMHTDNINWDSLKNLNGQTFTPKQINRTFFINQWDDAVVDELKKVWVTTPNPRAIVFCGTIDHALEMKKRIQALSFCKVDVIHAEQKLAEKNKLLSDFSDNKINILCTVDIFNEGLDVPDVNILVFQRVTHSRRIFLQQLGRGLRSSDDKEKVIVLDFVSDVRRFAAGLDLKSKIDGHGVRIDLPNKVTFTRVTGEDKKAETFLRQWLKDVSDVENAEDNESVLTLPPKF